MKKLISVMLLAAALSLSGCGLQKHVPPASGVEVDNIRVENYFNLGPNHEVFDKVPTRVLVIGAAQTETLLDLDVGDSIAYAVKYEDNETFPIKQCNQATFQRLHFIPRQEINMERMLDLIPDMIVSEESWYAKNKLGSTDYWNGKGVKTMVSLNTTSPSKTNEPETIEKEMKFITDLGKVYHKEDQAAKIVNATVGRMRMIRERTEGQERPKVMILDLLSTTISYGKNKIAGDMADSIGARVPETTAAVSDEIIMKENPDVVFVVGYGDGEERLAQLRKKKAFQHLSFIRNNRLYAIPLKYAYGPMTRTIDSVGFMAERIYPGQFHFEKEYDFHQ